MPALKLQMAHFLLRDRLFAMPPHCASSITGHMDGEGGGGVVCQLLRVTTAGTGNGEANRPFPGEARNITCTWKRKEEGAETKNNRVLGTVSHNTQSGGPLL